MILLIVKIALHISECQQGEREREIEKNKEAEFALYQKNYVFIRKFSGLIEQLNSQINKTPL